MVPQSQGQTFPEETPVIQKSEPLPLPQIFSHAFICHNVLFLPSLARGTENLILHHPPHSIPQTRSNVPLLHTPASLTSPHLLHTLLIPFQALQAFTRLFDSHRHTEAQRVCNVAKNRFPHILPAEHIRPSLHSVRNLDGSGGYINAVYTERHGVKDGFILTQHPLPETRADFWALLHDHQCVNVVNMSPPSKQVQNHTPFWPEEGFATYGPFVVELRSLTISAHITEVHLALCKLGQGTEREVNILQLDAWPMGAPVPPSPQPIIHMMQLVQEKQQSKKMSPIVITCWDGASRSGLYCTASNICHSIQVHQLVDVLQAAKTTRRSRPQALSTLDQYGFCYHLAQAYLHVDRTGAGDGSNIKTGQMEQP
ncbi:receptor-type tyrosine-protein phosphatase T-like [Narcine bancroftii]|uniref:receptor-type tyrosine-protein phosphatase T-like n=1 Tax=Narcine bancroftii TaxID=1343680 RepID=UPI003831DCC0